MVTPAGPLHTPVPTEVPAVIVAVVTLQNDWSEPALDTEGASTVILTVEETEEHTPLVTVQVNTFGPTTKPLTVVFGELAFPKDVPAGPDQTPALTVVFAFNVPVVVLHTSWSEPALD